MKSLPALSPKMMAYTSMFYESGIVETPEILAEEVEASTFQTTFYNCKSLTQAPELPATTLAERCYIYMFMGCDKLNYVKCLATDISAVNCTTNWFYGVSSTGDFYTLAATNWTAGNDGIPLGWTRHDIT